MSTRLEMATEVVGMLGNKTELLTLAGTWVDRSYSELQLSRPWRNLITTIDFTTDPGTPDYQAAADFYSSLSLRNNDKDTKIQQIGRAKYDRLNQTISATAPSHYAMIGDVIYLWPLPDAVYQLTHRYRRTLPMLADGDSHLYPPIFDDIIVLGAAARGFDYLNEHERSMSVRRMQRLISTQIEQPEALDLLDRDEAVANLGNNWGIV